MNPHLSQLQTYPFEKLRQLFEGVEPPTELARISLSIGEPKHAAPIFVLDELHNQLPTIEQYPTTKGLLELRQAISEWLTKRFKLQGVDIEHQVLPVNGTREALFAIVQAVFDASLPNKNKVLCPNPFYQIYEGAAYLAGGEPHFIPCNAKSNFLPDFDQISEQVWSQTQVLFLCTPGNPTGAVIPLEQLQKLIRLADEHDFIIASDECYSEIYTSDQSAPVGLLEACADMGRHDYQRCLVFHSLSKRSNLPGLRSGFVAGDADLLKPFLLYRTYHGCSMPVYHQKASIIAWQDESHVQFNRDLYTAKFEKAFKALNPALEIYKPDAGFYLWAKPPMSDTEFAQRLYGEHNLVVLPGSYLSREVDGVNPGAGYVRMALVSTLAECDDAFERINKLLTQG